MARLEDIFSTGIRPAPMALAQASKVVGSASKFAGDREKAEQRFPFIKQFRDIPITDAIAENKGGLGELVEPDNPSNPIPGKWTITVGPNSSQLQGGVADTIIADMVHVASIRSPEFQSLKKRLRESLSRKEMNLARRRYVNEFKGRFTGSNFATFENFLNTFWLDGVVQHLLLPENSEIGQFRQANPAAGPVLDDIIKLFESEISPSP